jgi:hypothetical protein
MIVTNCTNFLSKFSSERRTLCDFSTSDTLRRGGGKINATDLDLFFQQTGEFAEVLV